MSNLCKPVKRQIMIALCLTFAWNSWAADIESMTKLVDEVAVARAAMEAIEDTANVNEAAQIGARKRYATSIAKLDHARVETLEELAGASEASILEQRQRGQSWRAIADELNVHPSFIGIEIIDSRPPSFVSPISP
ncbi:MAG: hypothetical protein O3C28_06155 [Proteobacteria bacterium]|nr:hypothetical protein [Pseudomonadota bacterium]